MYFEIFSTDDGITIIKISDINKYLEEIIKDDESTNFLNDFPVDNWSKKRDKIYSENGVDFPDRLLIKGEIIVPKKVEVTTKFEELDE